MKVMVCVAKPAQIKPVRPVKVNYIMSIYGYALEQMYSDLTA